MAYVPTQTVESGATASAAAANNSPTASLTTLSVGDSVVGRLQWEGVDATPTVSDSAGNTNYVVATPQFSDGGIRIAHYYMLSAVSGGSSVVVTGSFGVATPTFRHNIATRGSTLNASLASSLPAGLDTPGTGTDALDCPPINISTAPAVIIAHAFDLDLGGPCAVGSGYTDIGTTLGNARVEYKNFAGTSASEAATFTSGFGSHTFSFGAQAFTTAGASPATLSAATPSGTLGTTTTATLGATTNQTSGTFYGVVDSVANLSGVTAAQVKAGQKASGAAALSSGNSSVSTTTPSIGITGLSLGTLYSYAVIQNNTNGDSNMLTGTFTTASALPNPTVRLYGPQAALRTIIGL